MPIDILLLSGLFSGVASGRNKNSSFSAKKSSWPTILPSIVTRESSNPLLKPSDNYAKLKKGKFKTAFMS